MSKKSLKNLIFLYFILSCIAVFNSKTNANDGLTVGETIPNPEFLVLSRYADTYNILLEAEKPVVQRLYDYKSDQNLLIAFMPDITDKNTYAKVMTSAFDTYFAEGLAFRNSYGVLFGEESLKILVVTNNDRDEVMNYLTGMELDFDMVAANHMNFENFFGISKWNSPDDASHVYIVNKENKILYASHDYKGQGEKLKTVQNELFSLLGVPVNDPELLTEYIPLIEGDNAREFDFEYIYTGPPTAGLKQTEDGRLSDYFGKKMVLLAFYPAAFSYSCGAEVTRFDTFAEEQFLNRVANSQIGNDNDFEILMVSQSNQYILSKWKNEMDIKNIKLVNDFTGEISMKYSSFNPLGYNRRTIFLIDKDGKVSYIDWDYKVDDEDFAIIKERLISMNN